MRLRDKDIAVYLSIAVIVGVILVICSSGITYHVKKHVSIYTSYDSTVGYGDTACVKVEGFTGNLILEEIDFSMWQTKLTFRNNTYYLKRNEKVMCIDDEGRTWYIDYVVRRGSGT
jgi:hypothetical protein